MFCSVLAVAVNMLLYYNIYAELDKRASWFELAVHEVNAPSGTCMLIQSLGMLVRDAFLIG